MSQHYTGKLVSKILLALYLAMLVWLVLFKLNLHLSQFFHYRHRSLNLIPFAAPSMVNGKINYAEILFNCLFFLPFGLLLNVNFKKVGFLSKLICILLFSLTAELLQYMFAIGATDITDVISNTFGGFLGLALYNLSNRFMPAEKVDRVVAAVGTVLLLLFIAIHASHYAGRSLWK